VKELAAFNQFENAFIEWLDQQVTFCNSLVDRIVTKDPGEELLQKIQNDLGYDDKLLTMCEEYRLWAIEGPEELGSVLTFTQADSGVFVKTDIEVFKSLKLHLLNGTHTLSAGLAYLSGFDTVKEGMEDPVFSDFVAQLMTKDIAKAIPYAVNAAEVEKFSSKVLDRFRNPFLQHRWINITLQNTMKMKMRNVPVILQYQKLFNKAPECMATGFAAFILFMKPVKKESEKYFGWSNDRYYMINDEQASFFYSLWEKESSSDVIVTKILANKDLWDADLSTFRAFELSVQTMLSLMIREGVKETMISWRKTRSMELSS
jgi:tagaturonate reductase